eukprot:CAMPEP_0172317186 /NCGR_PEP_ID=MMETSP1058-20130122/30816_1 /TAXON_ID=83371 /ORGANISM="Detonula confervacea, Strain CCMP 353" /LENGTH=255 /DNA_ID=CAMNT_0013031687 /DNA_START=285 /DNA_END=1049 /DNA_ORIENTATION=+
MPPKASVKARLARAFLNFLDEHGDYRTELEEAAARAAAAEANSLWARGRKKKKKKKKKRGNGKLSANGEEDELLEEGEEWEDDDELDALPDPQDVLQQQSQQPPKHPQLPEDPYEQIQFYFQTFTHRTQLQIEERLELYQTLTRNWLHDELHHDMHVPLLSGGMLALTLLLWVMRARSKKIGGVARLHGILGKKLLLSEFLHANFFRGRLFLEYSAGGAASLAKLREKAGKAESAALASMRPYQRKKYERFLTLG